MKYPYVCTACSKSFELEFPIGKAPTKLACVRCSAEAKRNYSGINFAVVGGSISTAPTGRTRQTFGQEMLNRNKEAGKRMKANRPPVRRIATDYGGGDVRGV